MDPDSLRLLAMKLSPAEREALDHLFASRPRPSRLAMISSFAVGVLLATLAFIFICVHK